MIDTKKIREALIHGPIGYETFRRLCDEVDRISNRYGIMHNECVAVNNRAEKFEKDVNCLLGVIREKDRRIEALFDALVAKKGN